MLVKTAAMTTEDTVVEMPTTHIWPLHLHGGSFSVVWIHFNNSESLWTCSRSTLKPPQELPYLASFQYYKDWMREEDPRTYDDKARMEESYKKYKSTFLYRSNKDFFSEISGLAWCKEKYGTTDEEEAERKRLRAKGREGRIDQFLQSLENGDLDELIFDQKGKLLRYGT